MPHIQVSGCVRPTARDLVAHLGGLITRPQRRAQQFGEAADHQGAGRGEATPKAD